MYNKFYLVPRKRKMLKACMSVLKIGKSRHLVDHIIQHIVLSETGYYQSQNKDYKGFQKGVLYENLDPYLRQNIYYH